MKEIRYFRESDIPASVELAIRLCSDLKLPYDAETLSDSAYLVLEQGVAVVAVDGDKIVGGLASMLYPALYNSKVLEAQELFWYVLPEYRKSRVGLTLQKAHELALRQCLVKRYFMSAPRYSHGSFDRFYRRKGFKKLETLYVKEL